MSPARPRRTEDLSSDELLTNVDTNPEHITPAINRILTTAPPEDIPLILTMLGLDEP